MKIMCQDCANLNTLNCVDTIDIKCRLGYEVVFDPHECEGAFPTYIPLSEDYKRGYLHGYNQCRNDVRGSLSKCLPDIPKEMKNVKS